MTETEREPTPEQGEAVLDRALLVEGLQSIGLDVTLDDWAGEDDNDILGNIAGLALEYGLDIDSVYEAIGLEVESGDSQE